MDTEVFSAIICINLYIQYPVTLMSVSVKWLWIQSEISIHPYPHKISPLGINPFFPLGMCLMTVIYSDDQLHKQDSLRELNFIQASMSSRESLKWL